MPSSDPLGGRVPLARGRRPPVRRAAAVRWPQYQEDPCERTRPTSLRRTLAALAAAPLVLAAAACGGERSASDDAAAGGGSRRRCRRRAPARLLRQRHARPRPDRRARRASSPTSSATPSSRPRCSTPARTWSRRSSPAPSTPPTSARAPRSTPTGRARATPSGSSPVPPPAARSSSSGRASTPPRTWRARRWPRPQLGNTQDVALRTWLTEEGLENSIEGGGDVTIAPDRRTPTPSTSSRPASSTAPGCPSPGPPGWCSRPARTVLVDERDLWPDGEFVTTHLIVRTEFLEEYPETVAALLRGHVAAVRVRQGRRRRPPRPSVNAGLEAAGSYAARRPRCSTARGTSLTVTYDPIASALEKSAEDGVRRPAPPRTEVDLDGIYDLRPLNAILADLGLRPGLGRRARRGVTDRRAGGGRTDECDPAIAEVPVQPEERAGAARPRRPRSGSRVSRSCSSGTGRRCSTGST